MEVLFAVVRAIIWAFGELREPTTFAGGGALGLTILCLRDRRRFAPRFVLAAVSAAVLAVVRLSPLVSDGGGERSPILLGFGATLAWATFAALPIQGGQRFARGAAVAWLVSVVLIAAMWRPRAVPADEWFASMPAELLHVSRQAQPDSVVIEGVQLQFKDGYMLHEFCEVDGRCCQAPLWENDQAPAGATVRIAWTPRLWILRADGDRGHIGTLAVDRATMKPTSLHASDLPMTISGPRLWTYVSLGGLALALALAVRAGWHARRTRWMRQLHAGVLGAGGALTVGERTGRFDGRVAPGLVAVRLVNDAGEGYRDALLIDAVHEGTPASVEAKWRAALLHELAAAAMVALVASSPLVGAALVGVSAATP